MKRSKYVKSGIAEFSPRKKSRKRINAAKRAWATRRKKAPPESAVIAGETPSGFTPENTKAPAKPIRTPGLRIAESVGINPKDMIADHSKIDLTLIPPIALYHCALALTDGDVKYGAYNWRVKPVQARTYLAAQLRHVLDFLEGEDFTPNTDSLAHHLGHAMACSAIVLDALHMGHLVDNRPLENPGFKSAKADITSRGKARRARG